MDTAELRAQIETEIAQLVVKGTPVVQAALEAVMKFHPRADAMHCSTCQCARTHAEVPTDANGNPRKRSWHHG
jgi:hypothetical protein